MNHDTAVLTLWMFVLLLSHVQSLTHLMVLGVGRVGRAVLDHVDDQFDSVCGVVRTNTAPRFLHWETEFDRILDNTKQCTHLLVTLPPDVQMERCDAIARHLPSYAWVGVISTTGVYGNHDGAWVTEESECRGRKDYMEHEATWLGRTNNTANIFRCAGIYGPQASALHTVFRNGKETSGLEEFPTNRIHLDDIVKAVTTSMRYNQTSCCYNLSDDEPTNRSTVLLYAAGLLESIGVNVTLQRHPTVSTGARKMRRDHKKVCNHRLKAHLVSSLKYPSYREGLVAILQDESCPWWLTKRNGLD